MNLKNNKKSTVTTSAIHSAALQDHLLKKFNFNLSNNIISHSKK